MISAVIITRNEETHIRRCIASLQEITKDIIVVDSGSKDNTIKIASSLGARVFHKDWKGYGANKNYGSSLAVNDWIISIDGDEVLSEELILSVKNITLKSNHIYQLNSLVNYGGKWIRHCGWYPRWKNRLYNRTECHWDDSLVHEDLTPLKNKSIIKIDGDLFHYSYNSPDDHKTKVDNYAKLRAQSWINEKSKPTFLKRYFGGPFAFVKSYILQMGMLDGKEGWQISKINAYLSSQQVKYYDQLMSETKV